MNSWRLEDRHDLLQKSFHNPCTSLPDWSTIMMGTRHFAILLSHDDFFYQEALTMMQSEAVMHVPMPDYRQHAFLPERNGRTGGTLPNDLPIQSWRSGVQLA